MILPITDLNLKPRFCEPSDKVISRLNHVRRQTGVRATDGPSSVAYVSTNCQMLRREAQSKDILVPLPVSLHGIRATYLKREFARHRGLSARATHQVLFFKWIKQILRIKTFFDTSENAVKSQIWIAVSVYVLVAIVKKRPDLSASLYEILQILSLTMFEKMPLDQLLSKIVEDEVPTNSRNQLNLFD